MRFRLLGQFGLQDGDGTDQLQDLVRQAGNHGSQEEDVHQQETDERNIDDVAGVEDANHGGGDPLVERLQHRDGQEKGRHAEPQYGVAGTKRVPLHVAQHHVKEHETKGECDEFDF